jgi:hypothetical protein
MSTPKLLTGTILTVTAAASGPGPVGYESALGTERRAGRLRRRGMRDRHTVRALALVAAAVLSGPVLIACGGSGADGPASAGGDAVATPSSAPAVPRATRTDPPPPAEADVPPSGDEGARARFVTLRGTLRAGVEKGCLLLATKDGIYLLVGGPRAQLEPGAAVEVFGALDDTRASTCQQGRPFLVQQVTRR